MENPENTSPVGNQIQDLPELRRNLVDPKGVLRKNLKVFVYIGAAAVVILAAILSSHGKKTAPSAGSNTTPPQPTLQDNTDNNVQDLKNQLAAERLKEQPAGANAAMGNGNPALAIGVPAQQAASSTYGQQSPCIPGQPCQTYVQQNAAQPQLTPAEEQAQQLAARERELAYNARFASNLVYARSGDASGQSQGQNRQDGAMPIGSQRAPNPNAPDQTSNFVSPRVADEHQAQSTESGTPKHASEVNIDSAAGQPYVVYEGLTMDTVLMNRLDGDAPGPVKVLVSNPVYSHDRQHVLIPEGTIVLGEARKIGAAGFGQQRRMAVAFHRMIMPDGYSVDLDQFHGLDQIGEEGIKDQVNNHYLQIFGTSIALGVIAGAGEITQGGGTITTSGSQAFTTAAASNVSQSATTVLDRFIQIPPTITIREGHRVKVYFTQDMLLPAYTNHTIAQTF